MFCRLGHKLGYENEVCHDCIATGYCGICGFSLANHDTLCLPDEEGYVGLATHESRSEE